MIAESIAAMVEIIFDDFDVREYTLEEGGVSADGYWKNLYNGGGLSGVERENNNNVFFIYPKVSNVRDDTYANLVVTTLYVSDFEMSVDVKTEKQLRQNNPPNPWEVAWLFFRYTDDFHYYWFTVKANGIEVGKKDCNSCTDDHKGQIFLYTDYKPTLEIGKWANWKIRMIENRITIAVNGIQVADFVDEEMSDSLSTGRVSFYSEDALVKFDNFSLRKYM